MVKLRQQPRRSPAPDERGRAAERTREKILAAAVAEFGAKGYAGTRTAGIAARAGVNQQLISYYFGGKQGVLDELRRRWAQSEAAMVPADAGFGEAVAAYFDATLDQPAWARLVIWRALGDDPGDGAEHLQEQRAKLGAARKRIQQRQRKGELTTEAEPGFVLLLTYALAFAPITMPHVVKAAFGVDPLSAQYRKRCLTQLLALLDPKRSQS